MGNLESDELHQITAPPFSSHVTGQIMEFFSTLVFSPEYGVVAGAYGIAHSRSLHFGGSSEP